MELLAITTRDCETILTVKVDGTFDRTGLPNPLIMAHLITIADGKITKLTCELPGNAKA